MPEDWASGGAGLIKYLLVFMFVCLFILLVGFLKTFPSTLKPYKRLRQDLMTSICQFTILCRHSETIDPVNLLKLFKKVRYIRLLCHNFCFKLAYYTLPELRTFLELKASVSDKVTTTQRTYKTLTPFNLSWVSLIAVETLWLFE